MVQRRLRRAAAQFLLHSSRGRGERLPASPPPPPTAADAPRTAALAGGERSGRAWAGRARPGLSQAAAAVLPGRGWAG